MYFNDENNITNIDKEFNNNNHKINFLNKKYLVYGIVIIFLVVFVFLLIMLKPPKKEYYLVLNGLEDIMIYQNSVFVEPGYQAYDNEGDDYTSEVTVIGEVNSSVAGEYVIQYYFNDIIKERTVTVIGEVSQVTYLNLLGNNIIYLKVGEEYKEPGYTVLDSVEVDLKNRVVIEGVVDPSKAGTYKLIYSVVNASGVTISAERTVIVMDSDISLSYSPMEDTNSDVIVTVNVISNYFDYVLLPDDTKNERRITTYKITANGEYSFLIFAKDGTYQEKKITINNIDKESPSGSCIATYDGKKTIVSVSASDNLGIDSYNYIINGSEKGYINENKYNYTGNGTSVFVDVKDVVGNVYRLGCIYKNNESESETNLLYNMTVAKQPSSSFPCNLDVSSHNKKLANKVKKYGVKTRTGVVAAATYLTRDLGYKIGYWWAGKYDFAGLNSEWGCLRKEWDETNTTGPFAYGTVHPFGLDCTGFIKWAFINAGFEASLIPRGDMSYYYGTVLPKKIMFESGSSEINNVKPGDLLWTTGHFALVIAVDDSRIKIAQSVYSGIKEDLVDKKTGKAITDTSDFKAIILLDEFFKVYGN